MTAALIDTVRIGDAPALMADVAGTGPLVILLHGVGGGRRNWNDQLPALAQYARAVAVDHRGYGDSGDYDGQLAFTDFADDVIRVADYFKAEQVHLCGLSMGGRIALDCYRRYPDRVVSLVLADTSAASAETQDPAKIEAFLAARRKPLLEGLTPAELAPQLAETLAGPNATPAQRAALTDSLAQLHRDSYLKTLEAVTRFTDFPPFASIMVPVQVIVGDEDKIAPPHIAQAIAAAIPGARLDVIPGAGHVSNVEAPEVFNSIIHRFYGEIL